MTSDQERAAPAQQPVADGDRFPSFEVRESDVNRALLANAEVQLAEVRAEIVRLTRERDEAVENYNRTWNQRDAQRRRAEAAESRVEALLAEVGKLTEALENIATLNRSRDQLQEMARAALDNGATT